LRTGKKHEHESSWEDYLPEFTEEGHHSELIDDWPQNPEDILLTEEAHTIIQNAIDQLPDDYRLVLILRDVEGLSNQETGDILRLGLGAVKSRLHRARLYLRGLLTEYLDESRK
jgi:RNA polymerase sigma-70 factor (ECF subfamily)